MVKPMMSFKKCNLVLSKRGSVTVSKNDSIRNVLSKTFLMLCYWINLNLDAVVLKSKLKTKIVVLLQSTKMQNNYFGF